MSPFEECQSPPESMHLMAPVLVCKGAQQEELALDVASSKSGSGINGHGSFNDMLDNFGKLQIECHQPILEPGQCPNNRPDLRKSHIICTKRMPGIEVKGVLAVNTHARDGLLTHPVTDQDVDPPVFNTPARIEDYHARRQASTGMFNRLTDLPVMPEEVIKNTLPDWESDSSSSDESEEFHPEDMELPEVPPLAPESILDGQPMEDLPAGNSLPETVSRPCRELITKRDGSRFIVTGMHHLSGYMPTDQRYIAELPFGSFGIKKLKSMLQSELERNVPLDCITFTGHEQHPGLVQQTNSSQPFPPRRQSHDVSNQKVPQWQPRTKMTPEDWHHVLMICDDEDWEDIDQLWRDFIPTVSSDFLCSICDASSPRPAHRRVRELRHDRL